MVLTLSGSEVLGATGSPAHSPPILPSRLSPNCRRCADAFEDRRDGTGPGTQNHTRAAFPYSEVDNSRDDPRPRGPIEGPASWCSSSFLVGGAKEACVDP